MTPVSQSFVFSVRLKREEAGSLFDRMSAFGNESRIMKMKIDGEHHVRAKMWFRDPMEAAIFLATISADPERAALFKLFWSGST